MSSLRFSALLYICFSAARAENAYPLVDQRERAGTPAELIHEIAQSVGVIQAGDALEAEQIIDSITVRIDGQKRSAGSRCARHLSHSIFQMRAPKMPAHWLTNANAPVRQPS